MGGSQSYGQAISTFNEKKAIIIGQVNVQTGVDHMTEIIVALGNPIHPQLWNTAIMEIRSTDTDFPLNYRRFCIINPAEEYQFQYIPEKINQFMCFQRPQRNQFHDIKGHFWTIQIPSYIKENLNNDDSFVNAQQIIYPFCDKMKLNLFREQYQQQYIETFKQIEEELHINSAYISIGILDMKLNNPILGIDNFQMTSDIIDAFIQCSPKIHKLIFISENESQAFIMGMALKDKVQQLMDVTNGFMEQEKDIEDQIGMQKEVPIKAELEIQFKQDEDIQLNSNCQYQEIQNLNQIQKIQKPFTVSYNNGHKQNIAYSFFREFDVPLNQQVFQTIIPRVGNELSQQCLCGRKVIIKIENNLCCYCGLQRPTFLSCEQRACGRSYCASCFYPIKIFNQCMNGHQMIFTNKLDDIEECIYCKQSTYRLGNFTCQTCFFRICAYCQYSKYSEWQMKKIKLYLNCLKKIKPSYRQEIKTQLITEYLLDANLQKIRQQ